MDQAEYNKRLAELVAQAPALDTMQRSLVESVLDYADQGDRQGVLTYCDSMSTEGLARFVSILSMVGPIATAKLMSK